MLSAIQRLLRRRPEADAADAQAPATSIDAAARDEAARLAAQGHRCVAESRLQEAVAIYERALALDPGHVVARSNLGFVLLQTGRLDEARRMLEQALALDPDREEPHLFLGQIAERQGDAAAAMRHLRDALVRKPDLAFAWQELCRLQFQAGDAAQARQSARSGLLADPDSPMLNFYLGNIQHEGGDFHAAAESYRRALAKAPDFALALLNLGQTLLRLKSSNEALECLQRAVELDPDLSDAHVHAARTQITLARFDDAIASFERALAARPESGEIWYELGELCVRRRHFDRAEDCFERAHALEADEARFLLVRANLLRGRGRLEAAESAYGQAIALRADDFEAHNNLGALLVEMDRPDEAEVAYRKALACAPGNPTARWNLSLLALRQGRLEEGWALHEARHDPELPSPVAIRPNLSFPAWRGEPLAGKSIVVVCEQGFGDDIQLVRYAALLKRRGAARVSWVCQSPLRELLRSAAGVDALFVADEPFETHDFWVLSFSLPGLLGTTLSTIPSALPYLRADPERVRAWAPTLPQARRRVGLTWKGSAGHGNDLNRSLPGLHALAPLWTCAGVAFVSLQKGQGEDEAANAGPGQPIADIGSRIASFSDTAAVLEQLDLVICVDTSTAHLAGALGRPCWVLLPGMGCDWRWLRDRDDSPWYPGVMRLFRQLRGEPWEATVERVAQALRAWADAQG